MLTSDSIRDILSPRFLLLFVRGKETKTLLTQSYLYPSFCWFIFIYIKLLTACFEKLFLIRFSIIWVNLLSYSFIGSMSLCTLDGRNANARTKHDACPLCTGCSSKYCLSDERVEIGSVVSDSAALMWPGLSKIKGFCRKYWWGLLISFQRSLAKIIGLPFMGRSLPASGHQFILLFCRYTLSSRFVLLLHPNCDRTE